MTIKGTIVTKIDVSNVNRGIRFGGGLTVLLK